MTITEQQAILLLNVLRDSIRIADGGRFFGLTPDQRQLLYNQIVDQQTAEITTRRDTGALCRDSSSGELPGCAAAGGGDSVGASASSGAVD